MGIEPTYPAWKAGVLPLNYTRKLTKENAEGGIRTHVPVRTNGFQDRLVMTTSIPLHNLYSVVSLSLCQRQDVYYHSYF